MALMIQMGKFIAHKNPKQYTWMKNVAYILRKPIEMQAKPY
jgi:hypothetical protein